MLNWIEVNLSWKEFCYRGLNEPGTLVEIAWEHLHLHGSAFHLLGTISYQGGVGVFDTMFPPNTTIKRYCVFPELVVAQEYLRTEERSARSP